MLWNTEKNVSHLVIAVATTVITACTHQVVEQPASSDGTGGHGAVTGSAGAQVASGAGGSGAMQPMTSGAGGSPLPPECAGYSDEPSPGTIPIHIVNHRMTSVFLRVDCAAPFHAIDGVGTKHEVQPQPAYVTTCDQALNGTIAFGDCMSYGVAEIAPGASVNSEWNGLFYDGKVLPAACKLPAVLSASCVQAVIPEPGPMVFTVELDEGSAYSQVQVEASTPFVLGTDTSIEITVN